MKIIKIDEDNFEIETVQKIRITRAQLQANKIQAEANIADIAAALDK